MLKRSVIIQKKTKKPVHFEITEQTRNSLVDLINELIEYPTPEFINK